MNESAALDQSVELVVVVVVVVEVIEVIMRGVGVVVVVVLLICSPEISNAMNNMDSMDSMNGMDNMNNMDHMGNMGNMDMMDSDGSKEWNDIDGDIRALTASLSINYQIGQMTQLDVNMFIEWPGCVLNETRLVKAITEYGVGSLLNSPFTQAPGPMDVFGRAIGGAATEDLTIHSINVTQWRSLITLIQQIALKTGPKLPIIYGLDSVHGANFVQGATIFPHQINCGASFNRDLVRASFAITAKDTRAAGIPWSFSPILGIGLQKQWPRIYETFGEDPYLASELGYQAIVGLQGYPNQTRSLRSSTKVAASMKHFVGYSNPRSGQDRTPGWIPDNVLRQYFLPSFKAAIAAGGRTMMEAFSDLNGVPVVSSEFYLKTMLRDELHFKGLLVTDWHEINNMYWGHHVAASELDATRIALGRTSIDMSMTAMDFSFNVHSNSLVDSREVSPERIAVSCARVLQLKKDLGLLTDPFPTPDDSQISSVGSDADHATAIELAAESLTLLKNDPYCWGASCTPILPLSNAATQRILVTGPGANSLRVMSGGWTIHWQGAETIEFDSGTTILKGIRNVSESSIFYNDGCSIGSCNASSIASIVNDSQSADVIIVVICEDAYAEKPGNIEDMFIDRRQMELIEELSETGVPIVTITTMGRPRLLGSIVDLSTALLHCFLPGPHGGLPIANVLFGSINPSGRLPYSWPAGTANLNTPYWFAADAIDTYKPQFPFGAGMSYTSFATSPIRLSLTNITRDQELQVQVDVTNTGSVDGKHTVLLFITTLYRTVSPENKILKRFEKPFIEAGQTVTLSFVISSDDLQFYHPASPIAQIENGQHVIHINDKDAQFALVGVENVHGVNAPLPAPQTLQVSRMSLLAVSLSVLAGTTIIMIISCIVSNRRQKSDAYAPLELTNVQVER